MVERSAGGGAGVRIAIVDSGIHAHHPHVCGVAGGVAIDAAGNLSEDYVDRIGHGTAVAGAIREKAPGASLYAVRIFDRGLSASAATAIAGIDWAIAEGVDIINLSLGTSNRAHLAAFSEVVTRAVAAGIWIVAAHRDNGVAYLPGSLPGVVGVEVDWSCPRDECRLSADASELLLRASGFARPIPGVDLRRNLHGVSFAVANVSGLLARARSKMTTACSWREALSATQPLEDYGGFQLCVV